MSATNKPPQVRINFGIEITPGVALNIDQDVQYFRAIVGGKWYVEIMGGDLIVRGASQRQETILKVPCV